MKVCDFVCHVMAEEIAAVCREEIGCIVVAYVDVDLQSCITNPARHTFRMQRANSDGCRQCVIPPLKKKRRIERQIHEVSS